MHGLAIRGRTTRDLTRVSWGVVGDLAEEARTKHRWPCPSRAATLLSLSLFDSWVAGRRHTWCGSKGRRRRDNGQCSAHFGQTHTPPPGPSRSAGRTCGRAGRERGTHASMDAWGLGQPARGTRRRRRWRNSGCHWLRVWLCGECSWLHDNFFFMKTLGLVQLCHSASERRPNPSEKMPRIINGPAQELVLVAFASLVLVVARENTRDARRCRRSRAHGNREGGL
jgi:hypothetical protein